MKSLRWLTPFSLYDLLGFLIVVLMCSLAFQHADIVHTIGCSSSYLFGHIRDFYSFNAKTFGVINYLPSTYILFAIWGLPLKLLGFLPQPGQSVIHLIFWYKIFTSLFYFGSAYLMKLIGKEMGLSDKKVTLLMVLWVTTPIAIFSQFIFGQYDILTVFFMLLGLYYYFKENLVGFAVAFSVALTFKYFPIFVFAPLLFLKEKDPKKIIGYCTAVLIPIAIEVGAYFRAEGFREGVFGFQGAHRIFDAVFPAGGWKFSIFFFGWFFLCAYSFLKVARNKAESQEWTIYLGLVSALLTFGFITWNPQWLLFITPFLALAAFSQQRSVFFYFLDLVMMYAFTAICAVAFPMNVDQHLWTLGIFGKYNPTLGIQNPFSMNRLIFSAPHNLEFWLALFSACLFSYAFFTHPDRGRSELTTNLNNDVLTFQMNSMRLRFYAGVLIWAIPATTSYLLIWHSI